MSPLSARVDGFEPKLVTRRRCLLSLPCFIAARSLGQLPEVAVAAGSVDYNQFSSSYDELDGGPLAAALGLTDLRAAVS